MKGAQELRQALCAYLKDQGLNAVTAWDDKPRKRPDGAVAAVSLRALESGPAGYQDYLGERYDETLGQWVELYGKQVELTFGLDLTAATAEEVMAGLEKLGAALAAGGPEGMTPAGYTAGETVYQSGSGRYFCPVQARFKVWAAAEAREGETFLDFDVRGENRV